MLRLYVHDNRQCNNVKPPCRASPRNGDVLLTVLFEPTVRRNKSVKPSTPMAAIMLSLNLLVNDPTLVSIASAVLQSNLFSQDCPSRPASWSLKTLRDKILDDCASASQRFLLPNSCSQVYLLRLVELALSAVQMAEVVDSAESRGVVGS